MGTMSNEETRTYEKLDAMMRDRLAFLVEESRGETLELSPLLAQHSPHMFDFGRIEEILLIGNTNTARDIMNFLAENPQIDKNRAVSCGIQQFYRELEQEANRVIPRQANIDVEFFFRLQHLTDVVSLCQVSKQARSLADLILFVQEVEWGARLSFLEKLFNQFPKSFDDDYITEVYSGVRL